MADLTSIVKAYDIRGVVPDSLDEGVAEAVGAAFVTVTGAAAIVTLHDMRSSSEPLAAAFGRGAAADLAALADRLRLRPHRRPGLHHRVGQRL